MPTVKMKTLSLAAKVVSTPQRAMQKRVFTDDQWMMLQGETIETLKKRIANGHFLIGLLYRPEMLNMTGPMADFVSSNLRYQIDEINRLIEAKTQERES